jgi:ADP-heptose:LPS heptosyltransferase
MHLIEQYALSCGVKIDKPHIETCFYPIAENKYITLHASSGMQAKNYDYYNDVMEMILPHLNSQGIKVIQIGGKEDKTICIYHTELAFTFWKRFV